MNGTLSRVRERVGVRVVKVEPLLDHFKHGLGLGQGLAIVEAQYGESMLRQRRAAAHIPFGSFGLDVPPTIEFDDRTGFDAGEVGEERPQRNLAAELPAIELAVPQALPDQSFGVGR